MTEALRNERRETIRHAAYRLADSGSYRDWEAIECCLCVRYGLIEARRLLVDPAMRTELNRRCMTAIRQTDTARRAD